MKKQSSQSPPLILVTPDNEKHGHEFSDFSISLSEAYLRAVMGEGGLPLVMPCTSSPELVAECVRRCDGVLLTGGDDIRTELYRNELPPDLAKTLAPDEGGRDARELMVIDEIFRQKKPLLAICRGHQLLSVAFGGSLLVDIPTQRPNALDHRRQDKKNEIVHDVRLHPESLLAKIIGNPELGVNSTHHQAVERAAGPLEVIGSSSDGIIEAMQLKSDARNLLPYLVSIQFHPERLLERYPEHRQIFSSFVAACVISRGNG